ncbi:MAG: SCP2 sterol-binding domain-containing protein [Methylophilaceae bacterium]
MFKPLATRFLQHLISQNNWARKHLVEFSGKVVQFDIAFVKTKLLILEDGALGIATDNADIDASIHIPPSLALRLAAKDETAKLLINIEGDSHLAAELAKILQLMRWDFEEDLSQVMGDIPANKAALFSKKVFITAKKQSLNAVEMLSEYWQEEKPILAKKWRVEQFNNQVDTLRSDYARFEKVLDKLAKRVKESSAV